MGDEKLDISDKSVKNFSKIVKAFMSCKPHKCLRCGGEISTEFNYCAACTGTVIQLEKLAAIPVSKLDKLIAYIEGIKKHYDSPGKLTDYGTFINLLKKLRDGE